MPTKNPRINIVLEEPLYRIIREMAEKDGLSMSNLSRDLIREALELREDTALAALAEKRDTTLKAADRLEHGDAWS